LARNIPHWRNNSRIKGADRDFVLGAFDVGDHLYDYIHPQASLAIVSTEKCSSQDEESREEDQSSMMPHGAFSPYTLTKVYQLSLSPRNWK
jgi:hypothetical protein